MLKTKAFYLSICGLAVISQQAAAQQNKEKQPNIVFILADDIGYGDLGAYGSKVNTPNFDKVTSQGIKFTNAHAVASTSTPSRYSLLTGQYAFRRHDTGVAQGDAPMIIKPDQHCIAALLQQAGYTTAAVGKWHLGLGDESGQNWNGLITPGPREIGFNYSYIMAATADRTPCVYVENQRIVNLDLNDPIEVSYNKPFEGEPTGKTHPELLTKMKPSHGHDQAIINGISRIGYMRGGKSAEWIDENIADSITLKAVKFIENNKDKPFFLYFGTNDVHVPRVPHPRFVGKSGMGSRGDAILEFDWSVGQVIETLDRLGLTENTIVIISSDNGPVVDDGYEDQAVELLGDHKPWGHLRGGKYSTFEAGTRVPFVVRWPKKIKPKTSDALISQIDFYATLAALANQPIPEGAASDSFNQLSTWLGKNKKGRDHAVEQAGSRALSIIQGQWKYIEPSNGSTFDEWTNIELGNNTQAQLYNLSKDINERNNVADQHPDKLKALSDLLEQLKKEK